MRTWGSRGLGLGVLHALAQVVIAALRVQNPDALTLPRTITLAVVVLTAAIWAFLDRHDTNWFLAALLAGPVAGLLGVAGQALLVDATHLATLAVALTGGAAFTALLILIPTTLATRVRPSSSTANPSPEHR